MSYIVPLIPVSKNLTKDNLFDNFDERTIINDDLNMAGYKIYNLKNPVDDYDATTKYYVDTKIYNINSANIVGNLSWNRLTDIPAYLPSQTSSLLVDSNIDIGNYKVMKNGIEILGLTNNSVITNYIADNAVTNNKIVSLDYSKLLNVPSYFNTKTSMITVDSNLDYGSTYLPLSSVVPTQNNHLVNKLYVDNKLSSGSISNFNQVQPSTTITAGPVGNTSNPITFTIGDSSRTDANLAVNGNVTNVNNPVNNNDATNKLYVDTTFTTATKSFSSLPPYFPSIYGWFDIYDLNSCNLVNSSGTNYVNYLYNKAPTSCPSFGNSASGVTNYPILYGNAPGNYYLKFNQGTAGLSSSLNVQPYSTSADICSVITIFIVHRLSTAATTRMSVLSFDNGFGRYFGYDSRDGNTTDTGSYSPACFVGSTNGYSIKFRGGNGTSVPVVVNANTWLLTCFSYTPQNGVMTCNAWLDSQLMLVNKPCPGQTASSLAWLGYNGNNYAGSTYNDRFNGDIREVLIYNRSLSDTERQDVEQFLKNKWILPFLYKNAG